MNLLCDVNTSIHIDDDSKRYFKLQTLTINSQISIDIEALLPMVQHEVSSRR